MTNRRVTLELLVRIRWSAIAVVLLCVAAIAWVIITPSAWSSCLILVGAAIALAISGKDPAP